MLFTRGFVDFVSISYGKMVQQVAIVDEEALSSTPVVFADSTDTTPYVLSTLKQMTASCHLTNQFVLVVALWYLHRCASQGMRHRVLTSL